MDTLRTSIIVSNKTGWTLLLMRNRNPFALISIVCELSRYSELFLSIATSSAGVWSGSIAIRTTSCLWHVRSRVLAFPDGSGISQALLRSLLTPLQKQLREIPFSWHQAASVRSLYLQAVTSSIHSYRERPVSRLPFIMKPPIVVKIYFLSRWWSKKLFSIIMNR